MTDENALTMENCWADSSKQLLGYLYSICPDHSEAEDLLQECYLRAWRNWKQFRGHGSRQGWLFAIARRVLADKFRRKKLSFVNNTQTWDIPVETDSQAEDSEYLWHIINQLPPEFQNIIKLRFAGQLSYAEIAQALDEPIGTVRSRLHRALKKIRSQIFQPDK
ncbi:MAG: RNA polymerase sigma factor [Sedimentisphaerales bacterium]|nr:RNA polymerase sigma factor [Sedimentisphaerales bacterium]